MHKTDADLITEILFIVVQSTDIPARGFHHIRGILELNGRMDVFRLSEQEQLEPIDIRD